ncbi:MAG: alginate lyase, partial [Firmicutes bacterium]|nr:alginate lyase [Bacillota bacterium]
NMARALAFMLPYIRDKEKWFKEPDVMFYDQWPVAQPALLFAWYRFRNDRDFDARTCYQTWLELDHFPSNGEVIRNLPLRNPVIWLL